MVNDIAGRAVIGPKDMGGKRRTEIPGGVKDVFRRCAAPLKNGLVVIPGNSDSRPVAFHYGFNQGYVERVNVLKLVDKDVAIAGGPGEEVSFLQLLTLVKVSDVLLVLQSEGGAVNQLGGRFAPKQVKGFIDL